MPIDTAQNQTMLINCEGNFFKFKFLFDKISSLFFRELELGL